MEYQEKLRTPSIYELSKENATHLINRAFKKAVRNKGKFFEVWKDLMTLFYLLKAYFRKEYTDISWLKIALALSAVIYLLNPMDAIPDVIPIKGLVDDLAVLSYALKELNGELSKFKLWMKSKDTKSEAKVESKRSA